MLDADDLGAFRYTQSMIGTGCRWVIVVLVRGCQAKLSSFGGVGREGVCLVKGMKKGGGGEKN